MGPILNKLLKKINLTTTGANVRVSSKSFSAFAHSAVVGHLANLVNTAFYLASGWEAEVVFAVILIATV